MAVEMSFPWRPTSTASLNPMQHDGSPTCLASRFERMRLDEAFTAIDESSQHNSDRDDPWRPILPVPAGAPPLTRAMLSRLAPAGFSFAAGWRYHDAEGRLLG